MSKNKTRILTYDNSSLEHSARSFDENGYMHVEVSNITKEQVAPYRGDEIPNFKQLGFAPDQIYYGYRPASELSKVETVESLNGIPVLLEHHPDSAAAPAKDFRIGCTGTDAKWDAPYLTNSLHIQDADAIARIKDGSMRELSLGYFYTPIRRDGDFNGEHYDFIMSDITCNHVALVERGRAGHDVLVNDAELEEKKMPEQLSEVNQDDILDNNVNPSPTTEEPQVEDKESALEIFIKKCVDAGLDPEKVKEDLEAVITEAKTAEDEDLAENETPEVDHPDQTEEPAEDEDELAEDAEEALKQCGLDTDDPVILSAFKKGFAEGAKFGEKSEENTPDTDANDDDIVEAEQKDDEEQKDDTEKKIIGEDSARRIANIVKREIEAKYNAIDEVRNSLGRVRVSAFDTAADVYAAALRAEGVNTRGFKKSECKNAYRALMTVKAKRARTSAMDSALKASHSNMSKILSNVKIGD